MVSLTYRPGLGDDTLFIKHVCIDDIIIEGDEVEHNF